MSNPLTASLATLVDAGIDASKRASREAAEAQLLVAGLIHQHRKAVRMKARRFIRSSEKRRLLGPSMNRRLANRTRKLRSAGAR